MGLNDSKFSIYNSDETKNITFGQGINIYAQYEKIRIKNTKYSLSAELEIPVGMKFEDVMDNLIIRKPNDLTKYVKILYGMRFEDDGINLIIRKPGVKIVWEILPT
jgi:hypothetical protein